jgi:RNA polymerase-binding transcription factor DksA
MKFIQNLQAALVRIENKTYGVCREDGKLIQRTTSCRPHATLSIEAKQGKENNRQPMISTTTQADAERKLFFRSTGPIVCKWLPE